MRPRSLLDPMARCVSGREAVGDARGPDSSVPLSSPHRARGFRLGRGPAAGVADPGPGDLRNACARIYAQPDRGRAAPGDVCGTAGEDPLPAGIGHQLRGTDAHLRVRRTRERPQQSDDRRAAVQLLGLQYGRFLRAECRVTPRPATWACRPTNSKRWSRTFTAKGSK